MKDAISQELCIVGRCCNTNKIRETKLRKTNPMRTASHTYLVHKTHLKQKALTLRIPLHVHDALNLTRDSADAAGYVFDIQSAVVDALERALERVGQELQALGAVKEGGNKAPQTKGRRVRKTRVLASASD
jgi:hypothetical protein